MIDRRKKRKGREMREIGRKGEKKKVLLRQSKSFFGLCLLLLPLLAGCVQEKKAEVSDFKGSTAAVESKAADPVMREQSLKAQEQISAEIDSTPVTGTEFRPEQVDGERKGKKYIRSVYLSGNKNWIAPVFLLGTEAAIAANREIRAELQEITENSGQAEKTQIAYQSWLKENILSVLIQAENGTEAETYFSAYNFDIHTGEKLTVDQLLQRAGMDWREAEQIFAGERKAYWRAVAVQNGRMQDSYLPYAEKEIETLQTFYAEGRLAAVLDEDKLLNLLVFLEDGYGESYWRLYCLTTNRTTLLQRNAYGGDFPAVALADPSAEELANVKIVKKFLESSGGKKKTYLLLPLWDGLSFEWSKKNAVLIRAGVETKLLWTSGELPGEDTIYIELNVENESNAYYYGIFRQSGEKSVFEPKDFQTLSQEERGILYLPVQ